MIYTFLLVLFGPVLIFGTFGLIDYYLFSPYWILIILGVPFLFFLLLTLSVDFFSGMKRGSEASGLVVAIGLMVVNCWAMLATALAFIIPYYIVKFIWNLILLVI
jgi:hypothetical protein